jgi:hypothetical protein
MLRCLACVHNQLSAHTAAPCPGDYCLWLGVIRDLRGGRVDLDTKKHHFTGIIINDYYFAVVGL